MLNNSKDHTAGRFTHHCHVLCQDVHPPSGMNNPLSIPGIIKHWNE